MYGPLAYKILTNSKMFLARTKHVMSDDACALTSMVCIILSIQPECHARLLLQVLAAKLIVRHYGPLSWSFAHAED